MRLAAFLFIVVVAAGCAKKNPDWVYEGSPHRVPHNYDSVTVTTLTPTVQIGAHFYALVRVGGDTEAYGEPWAAGVTLEFSELRRERVWLDYVDEQIENAARGMMWHGLASAQAMAERARVVGVLDSLRALGAEQEAR